MKPFYFRVFEMELNYQDARQDCRDRSSQLASIHSPNLNAFITGKGLTVKHIHDSILNDSLSLIGGNDNFKID